jgi:hypothetical protein
LRQPQNFLPLRTSFLYRPAEVLTDPLRAWAVVRQPDRELSRCLRP